jgi:hypothetical protein
MNRTSESPKNKPSNGFCGTKYLRALILKNAWKTTAYHRMLYIEVNTSLLRVDPDLDGIIDCAECWDLGKWIIYIFLG